MISTRSKSRRLLPLRVLLVEDGLVNQKLAAAILERQGHTVTIVGNGQEAVDLLERESFDLILMDVNMPILDGLAATSVIRARETEQGRRILIIAVTSSTSREQCLAAGMDDYIAKPLRADVLRDTLSRLLAG